VARRRKCPTRALSTALQLASGTPRACIRTLCGELQPRSWFLEKRSAQTARGPSRDGGTPSRTAALDLGGLGARTRPCAVDRLLRRRLEKRAELARDGAAALQATRRAHWTELLPPRQKRRRAHESLPALRSASSFRPQVGGPLATVQGPVPFEWKPTSRWCSSLRLMGRQGREGVTRRRGPPSEHAAKEALMSARSADTLRWVASRALDGAREPPRSGAPVGWGNPGTRSEKTPRYGTGTTSTADAARELQAS